MKAEKWKFFPEFNISEFACKCGKCPETSGLNMRISFMLKLTAMRKAWYIHCKRVGIQFRGLWISSGWRCESHEEEAKKPEGGTHFLGYACDIRAQYGGELHEWLRANAKKFGFHRIGLANSYVHVDSFSGDSRIPCPAIWTYQGYKGN